MLTKNKVIRLLGILLVVILPLCIGGFYEGNVAYAQNGGGMITGWVRDANGNPIEGIHIIAEGYDDDSLWFWTEPSPIDGSYSITGLPTGDYRVHAYSVIGGYWMAEFYDDVPNWEWEQANRVSVTEGDETPGINFELALGGAISGVVKTETGDPIEGLVVEACPFDTDGQCFYAWTDADGRYSIIPVLPGTYRVDSGWEDNWVTEFYSDRINWELADPVVVESSTDTSGIDFALALGGSISGVIENEAGDPLADVGVEACPFYEEGQCYYSGTDADGIYTMSGVPVGTYRVDAGWNGNWVVEFYHEQYDWNLADPVEVLMDLDTSGIDFTLDVGGTISGTVYEADGTTTIPYVHVNACDWGDTFCMGTDADENGNYTIVGLLGGDYRVNVWGEQGGWVDEFYNNQYDHDDADPVSVTLGSDTGGIDFFMDPGGSISGVITDIAGNPLANMSVDITNWGHGTCTDENGYYTISGLSFGTYDIIAGPDFCGPHQYVETVIFGVEINETTPDVGGINFTMELGGSISGNVSDANGPAAYVWVDACTWDDSFCKGAGTDENGDYVIYGLPGGDYRVHVWGGQGGWLDEFYNDQHNYEDADPVFVTVGVNTGGIDFFMDLAMGYHDYDQGDVPRDACNAGGWAMNPNDPESTVTVRILVDGTQVLELEADGYREDLEAAWNEGWGGCPGGTCAFDVSLWDYLTTQYEAHEILVEAWDVQSQNWYPLGETPKTLTCRTYDIYAYDPLTGTTTQITDLRDADEYNPSWSPNGKLVAHDVLAGNQHDIFITEVKTGLSTPLLGAEGGNDAVWSPNGKWIAFDRAPIEDYSIYILPAEGGVATLVRENAVSADWAPNGKRLVFQDTTDGSIRTAPVDGGKGGETIIAMSGANPVWSPDGNWIAYDNGGDIWKVQVNVKGTVFGEPIQVTSGPFDDQQPTWSADSLNIVYHSGLSRDYDLWSVPAVGGEPTWLTGAFEFGDYDPAYAKERTNIAYASFSPNGQAPRNWMAVYSYDPPAGTWADEESYTYHYEWEQGLESGNTDEVSFNVSLGADQYRSYVLLRYMYLRVNTPDACYDIDTIHPDQLTRFLFIWLNYGTYPEVLAQYDSMVIRAVWDSGSSTDFVRHLIIPRYSEADFFGYVCSYSMP